jgi:hypothetical protein
MLMQIAASAAKTRGCLNTVLFGCLGLVCVVARAQNAHDADLFPVHHNASWTYDVTVGRQAVALTANMTHLHTVGDATELTLEWWAADGHRTQTEVYRVSAAEVARLTSGRDGECRYVPPFPVLKSPLINGRRWTWRGVLQFQRREVPAEAAFSTTGLVSVPTPSGAIQAMKVHCDLTLNLDGQQTTQTTDQWFAPGVGIVQQRMQSGSEIVEGRLTGYNLHRASVVSKPAAQGWNGPLLRMLPHHR